MIDVENITRAVFDTLRQVAPDDFRFAMVVWDEDQTAGIFTNETDRKRVSAMLSDASGYIICNKPHHSFMAEEPRGNA